MTKRELKKGEYHRNDYYNQNGDTSLEAITARAQAQKERDKKCARRGKIKKKYPWFTPEQIELEVKRLETILQSRFEMIFLKDAEEKLMKEKGSNFIGSRIAYHPRFTRLKRK